MHKNASGTGLLSIELIIDANKIYLEVNCIRDYIQYQNKIVHPITITNTKFNYNNKILA